MDYKTPLDDAERWSMGVAPSRLEFWPVLLRRSKGEVGEKME